MKVNELTRSKHGHSAWPTAASQERGSLGSWASTLGFDRVMLRAWLGARLPGMNPSSPAGQRWDPGWAVSSLGTCKTRNDDSAGFPRMVMKMKGVIHAKPTKRCAAQSKSHYVLAVQI